MDSINPNFFSDLPTEIILKIFLNLDLKSVLLFRATEKRLHSISQHNAVFKKHFQNLSLTQQDSPLARTFFEELRITLAIYKNFTSKKEPKIYEINNTLKKGLHQKLECLKNKNTETKFISIEETEGDVNYIKITPKIESDLEKIKIKNDYKELSRKCIDNEHLLIVYKESINVFNLYNPENPKINLDTKTHKLNIKKENYNIISHGPHFNKHTPAPIINHLLSFQESPEKIIMNVWEIGSGKHIKSVDLINLSIDKECLIECSVEGDYVLVFGSIKSEKENKLITKIINTENLFELDLSDQLKTRKINSLCQEDEGNILFMRPIIYKNLLLISDSPCSMIPTAIFDLSKKKHQDLNLEFRSMYFKYKAIAHNKIIFISEEPFPKAKIYDLEKKTWINDFSLARLKIKQGDQDIFHNPTNCSLNNGILIPEYDLPQFPEKKIKPFFYNIKKGTWLQLENIIKIEPDPIYYIYKSFLVLTSHSTSSPLSPKIYIYSLMTGKCLRMHTLVTTSVHNHGIENRRIKEINFFESRLIVSHNMKGYNDICILDFGNSNEEAYASPSFTKKECEEKIKEL